MAAAKRPHDVRAEIINIEMALAERLHSDRVRVPPYPAVCTKLQAATADPRTGARAISKIIATDAALTATVFRHACAASMSRSSSSTLETAVAKLGANEIVRLAVELTLGKSALGSGPLGGLRRDVWRRTVISAQLCELLAPHYKIDAGEAFVAGLLHDFGAVVVAATLEDVANERRLAVLPETTWHDLTMKFHTEFGRVVGERWQLPATVVATMSDHHEPGAIAASPMLGLVALVDQIVAILDRGGSELAALQKIGLPSDQRVAIAAALPTIVEEMSSYEHVAQGVSLIAMVAPDPDGFPITVELVLPDEVAKTCMVWPDRFSFVTRTPTRPNWLAQVQLRTTPPLELLVNIRSCEPDPRGGHLSIAQPYALNDAQKEQWLRLVAAARGSV